MNKKLLVFVVAYNAETTIQSVLTRIPAKQITDMGLHLEVLIIDDSSVDSTFASARESGLNLDLTVLKNPRNLGYGGNQKLGYHYAISKGFDFVALIHGDGQYAPEKLPGLLQPLVNSEADAVFGSRMIDSRSALKGGMPLYKYIGNKIITFIQNKLVGTTLSEYHSGYRLYSTEILKKIPFEKNSNHFDFDTDIIIQLKAAGAKIRELPIPTFYGDEICYVNGVQYGSQIIFTSFLYRLQSASLFYQAKFDLESANLHYQPKFDFCSSHQMAKSIVTADDRLLVLGCGSANIVREFVETGASITALDSCIDAGLNHLNVETIQADLDTYTFDFTEPYTKILALDIIEHLKCPEDVLSKIREHAATCNAELILTTPNIAFFSVRIMLLLGFFNYGKRGILDKTHTRLFTFQSLKQILNQSGFEIHEMRGIPAPFPLAIRNRMIASAFLWLNRIAISCIPSLFSYQIFTRSQPRPTVSSLLNQTIKHSAELTTSK